MPIDEAKLNQLVQRVFGDLGAIFSGAMVVIGDHLGLYKALAENGPLTAAELAQRTTCAERYVRECLAAQAAAGYVNYDSQSARFSMTAEQAMVFADDGSPAFMPGGFEVATAMYRGEPKIADAFRTGRGVGWHEQDAVLFRGTERFFRPGYNANLVSNWIPALDGVVEKLTRGAMVADVGCGHGASTIVMAKAFAKSKFYGFDYHDKSIERARESARQQGVADRVTFEKSSAKDYPARGYDLVAFFDCLHDMGDPVGAAAHVREALAPDGTWLLVEPFANDKLQDNLNPIGRVYYAASTMLCVPGSLDQEVGLGLGAQAGEARLRDVVTKAGFKRFRRATQTPFNLIFEV
ncbi:MAG: class I SAM-dependent methyltransferase, partial [Candidatus Binataceae bacterium]